MEEKNKKDIQGEIKDMETEVHLKMENSKNIHHKNRNTTGGIMIIVIGVIFLLNNFIPTKLGKPMAINFDCDRNKYHY